MTKTEKLIVPLAVMQLERLAFRKCYKGIETIMYFPLS